MPKKKKMQPMREIEDYMHGYFANMANTMCEQYCKYHEQYKKDQAEFDDKNPTYFNHCVYCPMIQFYT